MPNRTPPPLPGLRGIEHVGLTVPDMEEATRFFVEVLGCELIYDLPPIRDDNSDWMARQLNVDPRAVVEKLRFFRCANAANIEVFQYSAPHQTQTPPQNSDIGGHHLAFYVDDFDVALAELKRRGAVICGEPVVRGVGPSAGQTWVYFLAPWGLQLELVSFPKGKAYEQTTERRLWQPAHSGTAR